MISLYQNIKSGEIITAFYILVQRCFIRKNKSKDSYFSLTHCVVRKIKTVRLSGWTVQKGEYAVLEAVKKRVGDFRKKKQDIIYRLVVVFHCRDGRRDEYQVLRTVEPFHAKNRRYRTEAIALARKHITFPLNESYLHTEDSLNFRLSKEAVNHVVEFWHVVVVEFGHVMTREQLIAMRRPVSAKLGHIFVPAEEDEIGRLALEKIKKK